ncbi:contactin-2 isoform X3 [Drosophila sulfurigaster albostrigata]|uniref:contactin-2 isoform X3 n=1 Tax=Drosophila sulfurigaster albostrigata TaxID=89887 RepID=UPI002D219092|nr:contactin-2 isoform X3 [Drosophila sulfurigaster albostrigata]
MSSTSSSVLTLSSFNLLFFTQVLTVLSITIKYNEYATDKGGNFSIPCIAQGNIMWVKEHGNNNTIIQTGRVLVLRNVSTSDSGIYVCFATLPVTTRRTTTTATTTSATVTTAIAATSRTITTATATATTTTTQAATIPATAATTSPQQQQQQQENEEKQEEHKQNVKIADDDEKGHDNEQVKQVEQVEEEEEELEYQAFQRIRLTVRTTPGPVTQLYFKASTILGFLIWRFNKTQSGGYPVRSFTAEYRNVSYRVPPANVSYEHEWSRMDPINIAPNVRQMEVYRLAPNTTYEFRIWANNELGSGEVVTTNVTTLPETKEEELQDGWDSIELIPNIILNPGFSESDGAKSAPPFTRTVIFGHNGRAYDDDDDDDEDYEEEQEPTMEKFKRKVSVFFTGPTIKRI